MSPDVTLFHMWPSLCSQKIRLTLVEKGVEYTGHLVNIGPAMENYAPWYVRLNPRGVVPTLEHGETVVTDSLTIMRYIDDTFDGPALMPPDPEQRARAESLLAAMDGLAIRALSYAGAGKRRGPLLHLAVGARARRLTTLLRRNPDLADAYRAKLADVENWRAGILDAEQIEDARARVHAVLDELDTALASSGGPFILGERYTLVDVMATTVVARAKTLGEGVELEKRAHLAAWYKTVRRRPSFAAATIMERFSARLMLPLVAKWALPRMAALLLVLAGVTALILRLT